MIWLILVTYKKVKAFIFFFLLSFFNQNRKQIRHHFYIKPLGQLETILYQVTFA